MARLGYDGDHSAIQPLVGDMLSLLERIKLKYTTIIYTSDCSTILPIVANTNWCRDDLLGYLIVFKSNSCRSPLFWVPIEKGRIVGGEVFCGAVSYIRLGLPLTLAKSLKED